LKAQIRLALRPILKPLSSTICEPFRAKQLNLRGLESVLFGLYDRLARLAVEQAEKAVKFSQTNFERQKQLQQVQGTSTRLYQEAQQQFEDANNLLCRAMAELDPSAHSYD
jgi:multidrug resistance efflux pump